MDHITNHPTIPFTLHPNDPRFGRALIVVGKSDTAPNPASTKGPIYGPCAVVYEIHGDSGSISAYIYDDEADARADWPWLPMAVAADQVPASRRGASPITSTHGSV